MELFSNHKTLYGTATLLFLVLTLLVAVFPALDNQDSFIPLPESRPLTFEQIQGKKLYISNGCVACHTQQVRNVEMDKGWGTRPSVAADYAGNRRINIWVNTATLMGTERTGPDLTNIGQRQPGKEWHLLHLFQPRSVVEASIMPAYPWLFKIKSKASRNEIVVNVPAKFLVDSTKKIVATKEALYLVAYLQSLRQVALPIGTVPKEFLYKKKQNGTVEKTKATGPDGAELYVNNCLSCHQANGEGVPGAFPALKNSKVVLDDNIELMVTIIMQGYDAREEFAVMPAVGTINNLTAEQIAAIMNHEKTSWGNNGKKVTADQVEDYIKKLKMLN